MHPIILAVITCIHSFEAFVNAAAVGYVVCTFVTRREKLLYAILSRNQLGSDCVNICNVIVTQPFIDMLIFQIHGYSKG